MPTPPPSSAEEPRNPWSYTHPADRPDAPIDHHLPPSAPGSDLIDAPAARQKAAAAAAADAQSGAVDDLSIQHEAPAVFEQIVMAELRENLGEAGRRTVDGQSMGEAIKVRTASEKARADAVSDEAQAQIASSGGLVHDLTDRLMGAPPYEGDRWADPARICETPRQTLLRTWGPLAVLLPTELIINTLALQLLNDGLAGRLSFAIVVSVAGLWAGHMAGVWWRAHQGDRWRAVLPVPLALGLLVLLISSLMGALRVAYIDQPAISPIVISTLPSTAAAAPAGGPLEDAGIPAWTVWAGVAAVQLIFFLITVLQTAHTHNPVLRALQQAVKQRLRLVRDWPEVVRAQQESHGRDLFAAGHTARTARQWAAWAQTRTGIAAESIGTYYAQLTRTMGDPDFTIGVEARVARSPLFSWFPPEPLTDATQPAIREPDTGPASPRRIDVTDRITQANGANRFPAPGHSAPDNPVPRKPAHDDREG